MTTNKTDKRPDIFFRSPIGIARYPRTEVADTRFDEKGVFSVGLILATDEIAEVEAKMREIYRAAFPDDRREVKLPFKEDEGQRYLLAKSSFQPKVCDAERRPITTVEHGQTIRVVGRLHAYKPPHGRDRSLPARRRRDERPRRRPSFSSRPLHGRVVPVLRTEP